MHIRIAVILVFSSNVLSQEIFSHKNMRLVRNLFESCSSMDDLFKCFKLQALKVTDRALHLKNLPLFNGVSIITNNDYGEVLGKKLNETKLESLGAEQIDSMLVDTTKRFLKSHRLSINLPKAFQEEEESRKKKEKGGGYGMLGWAMAIKMSFLTMAYKGIAVMAGTALIVGKIALLLSAILGLKKLVSSGHEKTTFEIIKQPKYSESHTHSSSYEDDGHYRRNYDYDDFNLHKKLYRNYIPAL